MIKEFDGWNQLKQKIEKRNLSPTFQEREIWWCSLGINIGYEENGKNNLFNRPVLVVRKFNNNLFLGIPLSSKIKDNKFYYPIHFKEKVCSILLSQIRVIDAKRLTHKMSSISRDQFFEIREKIKEMI